MQPTNPMIQIKSLIPTEYDSLICEYFNREFPNVKVNNDQLLEILSEILLGTKETRYGAIPAPEHLVVIRDVIRTAIEQGTPIPILVPFGGIKGNKSAELDIAEVSAIKRLVRLDSDIKRFYSQGIHANIRVEDLGALWLYGESYESIIQSYARNMNLLTVLLAGDSRIHAKSEWVIMQDKNKYFQLSDAYSRFLFEYMYWSDGREDRLGKGADFEALQREGWKGVIPFEQREYYINTYMKLEPGITRNDAIKKLADYFGGSKARYDMNGIASPSKDSKHIQISYVQPIPGVPKTMFNNTLYYRTLPLSEARSHMPAWRSKGYLKIDSKGEVKAKITSWNDKETIDQLTKSKIQVVDGDLSVDIQSDYLLE